MRRNVTILGFILLFLIGLLYAALNNSEEGNEFKEEKEEVILQVDTLQRINDSISIRQIRQMDSLYKAGKL